MSDRTFYCSTGLHKIAGLLILGSCLLLGACGGGGSSHNTSFNAPQSSSSSQPILDTSSSKSSSSSNATVMLHGTITYDYVPHNANHIGLDYSATEKRPVRGAVIELLNESGIVQASGITGSAGEYAFTVIKNISLKVRVKAELLRKDIPTWDFKVTDNTNNNGLYVLDGTLSTTGNLDSQRDLHAPSGWGGSAYTSTRVAAPFAILDDIYIASNRLNEAGNTRNLPPMELRWSVKNKAAKGDVSRGEIETSSYVSNSQAIYILGDENNDTDEYDRHVLLHEWGHYLESNLFRSDSIGGSHSDADALDMRVAMSEGFANAFSAIMLNDENYSDASGTAQLSGFTDNISKKNRQNKGYFSEGSIGSIFFNFYADGTIKIANDFTSIFQTFSNPDYYQNDALTSIYLFYNQLKQHFITQSDFFNTLMREQNIFGSDQYASGESNSAGLALTLPIYKTLVSNNNSVNVCSTAEFGKYNKLADSQFLRLNIQQSGSYTISAKKSGGADVITKPEFLLYRKGLAILYAKNTLNNSAAVTGILSAGDYIVEIYDVNNHDEDNTDPNTTCFDISAVIN